MAAVTGFIRTTSGVSTEHASPDSNLDYTRISEVFNRNFLKHAIDKLVLADVAEKFDLPRNAGTQTMRFFRRAAANVDNVRTLTEGTPLSAFTLTTLDKVDTALAQYGDATKISDTRVATDLIKQLELETARMGEEAALHLDTQIRDVAYTALDAHGTNEIDCTNRGSGSRNITALDLDAAATILAEARAPTFAGGHYVGVLSPRQAYDIRQEASGVWQNVGSYQSKEQVMSGEIGKLYNIKIVVANNTKTFIHNTTFTGHAGWVFGRECVGTVKLAGSNSPLKPQLIYNDKPDKSDPLGQYSIVGWKAYYASMVLNPLFGVLIKSDETDLTPNA
tara:strand:+ start:1331 stop:2335 length:1005 start_codon:yes stop_codon:yes gene_type:complete